MDDSTRSCCLPVAGSKLLASTLARARQGLSRLEGIHWTFRPSAPIGSGAPCDGRDHQDECAMPARVESIEDVQQIAARSNHVVRTSDRLARRNDGGLHRATVVIADCIHDDEDELADEMRRLIHQLLPDDGPAAREAKILIGACEPLPARRLAVCADALHVRCVGIDCPLIDARIEADTRALSDAMRTLLDALKLCGDLGAMRLDKREVSYPLLLRVWTQSVFKQATLPQAVRMLAAFDEAQRCVARYDDAREANFIDAMLAHAHPSRLNLMLLDARHVFDMRHRLLKEQAFAMVIASRRGLRRLADEGMAWCALDQWE